MHDLVIRGGLLLDGTGADGTRSDLAIDGETIVAVGNDVGPGRREIDASGLVVTPGFVDIHTHYDGQATWDPQLSPSCDHGVTTVVMGNCGVGFAPCRADDRAWLINVMEGVEDIPGSALSEGIKWEWESFPQYLDALARRPFALDLAAQLPHSALRGYVMGRERAEHEDAREDEIHTMAELVGEALRAGAFGFTTSRTPLHKSARGVEVAGTHAAMREVYAMADAVAAHGRSWFQIAVDNTRIDEEVPWLDAMSRKTGAPVLINLTQMDQAPDAWRAVVPILEKAKADGVRLVAQVAGRSIGVCMCWRGTAHPFVLYPSWQALAKQPWAAQLLALKDPAFRRRLLAETPVHVGGFEAFVTQTFGRMYPMGDGFNYEPDPSESLAARALAEGKDPRELAYDQLMADDGEGFLYFPLFNYASGKLDMLRELHSMTELTRIGLADGGAHCGSICDGGMPTFMLSFWGRDRDRGPRLSLPYLVMRQTKQTAETYGLLDRGVLAPGYRADVNVIDLERLRLGPARMVFDLPAGGRRLRQNAEGYRATIKNGRVTFENGEFTGELPGGLLRGHRAAIATVEP